MPELIASYRYPKVVHMIVCVILDTFLITSLLQVVNGLLIGKSSSFCHLNFFSF